MVNIYDATGDLPANVVFGRSPSAIFTIFDSAALQNNTTISTLSAVGSNAPVSIVIQSNIDIFYNCAISSDRGNNRIVRKIFELSLLEISDRLLAIGFLDIFSNFTGCIVVCMNS